MILLADAIGTLAPVDLGLFMQGVTAVATITGMVTWTWLNIRMLRAKSTEPADMSKYVTIDKHDEDLDEIRGDFKSMGEKVTNIALDVREIVTIVRERKNDS